MKFRKPPNEIASEGPLLEAAKAGASALVQSLVDQRIRAGMFVLIVLRGDVPEPLHSVQLCSNLPPERARELCRILGADEPKPAANEPPQIIVPSGKGH